MDFYIELDGKLGRRMDREEALWIYGLMWDNGLKPQLVLKRKK